MTFAVIFDMDGVLVDSNPAHEIALKQFSKQKGFDLTEEQLRTKIFGRTNKDWLPNLFGDHLTPAQIKEYGEEKEAIFRAIYRADIKPVEGLLEFLERLAKSNIPMAIGTSAPRSNVDFVLKHLPIEQYFHSILDESYVSKGKPNPEIYIKCAEALGLDPANCIVIEDSVSGVAAAQGAGCKVVGITTTHTEQELAHTDLIINDFKKLTAENLAALF
jgi:beta-phosphoglucomutase